MLNWYMTALRKYAVFTGRARRSEYWWFTLCNLIIIVVLSVIGNMMGGQSGQQTLAGIYSLAVLIPGVAVGVRRLHDVGKSGWWYLLVFVPIVGGLVLLFWFIQDSEPGDNQWGPNPKEAGTLTAAPV